MDILTGFEGILQVDGYTGYDALAEPKCGGGIPLTLAYCWAHSRRKLHDIYQKDGSECVFRRIRPPVPKVSGHPFRSIRPPVTRCREASCFGYQS